MFSSPFNFQTWVKYGMYHGIKPNNGSQSTKPIRIEVLGENEPVELPTHGNSKRSEDVREIYARLCGTSLPIFVTIALLVIGCVAARGLLSGAALHWSVAGLTIGGTILQLSYGGFLTPSVWVSLAKWVTTIALISIAMTTTALSTVQLGYGLIGTMAIGAVLRGGSLCCDRVSLILGIRKNRN